MEFGIISSITTLNPLAPGIMFLPYTPISIFLKENAHDENAR